MNEAEESNDSFLTKQIEWHIMNEWIDSNHKSECTTSWQTWLWQWGESPIPNM